MDYAGEHRMLDALGRWRWTVVVIQNVLEAPDSADGGLLIVSIRDLYRLDDQPCPSRAGGTDIPIHGTPTGGVPWTTRS